MYAAPTEEELAATKQEEVPSEPGFLRSTASDLADLGLGAVQGVSLNTADELEAALRTTAGVLSGNVDPSTQLFDRFRADQQKAEKKYKDAAEASPWLYGAGELGGGLASGIASGGGGLAALGSKVALKQVLAQQGMKGLGKELGKRAGMDAITSAPVGVVQALGNSDVGVEDPLKLAENAAFGGASAGLLGAGMNVAGSVLPTMGSKIGNAVNKAGEENDWLRQIKRMFDMGMKGEKVKTRSEVSKLASGLTDSYTGITNRFVQIKDELGANIGNKISQANASGITVDAGPELGRMVNNLNQYQNLNTLLTDSPEVRKVMDKVFMGQSIFTPEEARTLTKEIDSLYSRFNLDNSPVASKMRQQLATLKTGIQSKMEAQIPGLAEATKLYHEFLKVPEQIMNKDVPLSMGGKRWSEMQNPEKSLFGSIQEIGDVHTQKGDITKRATQGVENLKKQREALANVEQQQIAAGKLSPQDAPTTKIGDLDAELQDIGDRSAILRYTQGYDPNAGGIKGGIGELFGKTLGRGGQYMAANASGRLTRGVFELPDNAVKKIGEQALKIPNKSIQNLGQALINNPTPAAKNAALFSLVQMAEGRKFLEGMGIVDGQEGSEPK
jgi:hypothetical protein